MFNLHLTHDIKQYTLVSLAITLICSVISSVFFVFAQPLLPVFYSLALPEQQLVPKLWIFIIPAISLCVTLIHVLILRTLSNYDRTIQRLFVWITAVLQVLLLLSVLRIIYITT